MSYSFNSTTINQDFNYLPKKYSWPLETHTEIPLGLLQIALSVSETVPVSLHPKPFVLIFVDLYQNEDIVSLH